MKLYASPLSCSMATKILFQELERPLEVSYIDPTTRRAPDGFAVPLGQVPVLRLDDGRMLTENVAILPFVAEGSPLVPSDRWQRHELTRWLSFIATELHKVVFIPLLDKKANDEARAYALANAPRRLGYVEQELAQRDHLLAAYSVADIYLLTVLNWAQATPIQLADYPGLAAFMTRMKARPAVARVLDEDSLRYREERGAHAARVPGTRAVLDRFNEVFLRHDPAPLEVLIADGCLVANTNGEHHQGKAACVALWTSIATDPALSFDMKRVDTSGEWGTITWVLRRHGAPAIEGVNVMRVCEGRICEGRGYSRPLARASGGAA